MYALLYRLLVTYYFSYLLVLQLIIVVMLLHLVSIYPPKS